MGKYIDKNLSRNEQIIVKAKFSIFGGLIGIFINELAVTNKNVVGKAGFIRKKTMSSPLDKVQNISVSKGLFGSIFGYGM